MATKVIAKKVPAKKTAAKKVPAKKAVAKKAVAKNAPAKKATAGKNPDSLRIRMYRVGFGDFFLITVPTEDGPQHIVVDCGVYKGTTGKGDIATIKTAVRHMAAETDSKLALIIVTHRHADHIIGFSRCADEFSKFEVDAIWMPVWENEFKPKVAQFQADLEGLAFSLQAAALAGDQDEDTELILGMVENATGKSAKEGTGGGTNAKSLKLLKRDLGVTPQYLAKGDKPKLPSALSKAGLTAKVLGPPPVGEFDFLKLMDLKTGVGQYLDAATGGGGERGMTPFELEYKVTAADYPASAFREWVPRIKRGVFPDPSKRYSGELEEGLRAATPAALLMAAEKLNDVLNNQSLVVLFGWKGKTLLFAGDAQGGNWEYWLYDDGVPAKDPTTLTMSADSEKILGAIDFYKVGHHGSTNATPIPAVDAMGQNFVSMCSTQADTYGNEEKESEVPRVPLLAALAEKSALVRSDQFEVSEGDVHVDAAVEEKLPKPKAGRFEVGSCFVDYFL
jgi:beta-lactamase superfamily II metal-dependent hydrolase